MNGKAPNTQGAEPEISTDRAPRSSRAGFERKAGARCFARSVAGKVLDMRRYQGQEAVQAGWIGNCDGAPSHTANVHTRQFLTESLMLDGRCWRHATTRAILPRCLGDRRIHVVLG